MSIYQDHKPEAGSAGLFLKLEDGQKAQIRVASEPVIFQSEFRRGDEVNISTRYAWVVWNTQEKVAQIWQGSATFFRNLANYANDTEYGDPTNYDIKITREGTGTDTQYHITPGRQNTELDEAAKAKCDAIDLPEVIAKSSSNSNVFWLADFVKNKPEQSGYQQAKAVANSLKVDDLGGEPINLEDIPF